MVIYIELGSALPIVTTHAGIYFYKNRGFSHVVGEMSKMKGALRSTFAKAGVINSNKNTRPGASVSTDFVESIQP